MSDTDVAKRGSTLISWIMQGHALDRQQFGPSSSPLAYCESPPDVDQMKA